MKFSRMSHKSSTGNNTLIWSVLNCSTIVYCNGGTLILLKLDILFYDSQCNPDLKIFVTDCENYCPKNTVLFFCLALYYLGRLTKPTNSYLYFPASPPPPPAISEDFSSICISYEPDKLITLSYDLLKEVTFKKINLRTDTI